VEQGFDYLLALQMGGEDAVAGRTEADPELASVLLRLAEDIIWPVKAVDGEADPCADSFALDEVGCVLLSALRDWARNSPTTAAPGTACSIIRFTANVIPAPEHRRHPGGDARRAPDAGARGALRTRRPPAAAPPWEWMPSVRPTTREWCASGGLGAVERAGGAGAFPLHRP
jgi:hypothetical protein